MSLFKSERENPVGVFIGVGLDALIFVCNYIKLINKASFQNYYGVNINLVNQKVSEKRENGNHIALWFLEKIIIILI